MENTNCVLRRRADTGAFASGHSAATTDSTLISHFAFNHKLAIDQVLPYHNNAL